MTATDSRVFGPYEIVRRLGVGGMAETFLALRRGTHGVEQRVCLKRVLPAFAGDPSFLRQFEREARIASTLRHSGIVSVVEFGDVEGTQYLALELVDGVDLRDYLSSQPGRALHPLLVARIALDLGHALRHAHESGEGVVHRDVSPANVLLSRTGEVKLTDFGVARVMSSAAPTTSSGVRGKIAYMSPEQLRGDELDGRADLFGLGVVLFEALAGKRPFQGAHDVEIMRRIADGERPHVSALAPAETPPELLAAIEGLLATEREQRTPSATLLIEQLSSLYGLHGARRRLGGSVDALRGGPETREHVTTQRDEGGDTRLGPVPAEVLGARRGMPRAAWAHGPGEASTTPPQVLEPVPPRPGTGGSSSGARQRLPWLALGGLAALASLASLLWWTGAPSLAWEGALVESASSQPLPATPPDARPRGAPLGAAPPSVPVPAESSGPIAAPARVSSGARAPASGAVASGVPPAPAITPPAVTVAAVVAAAPSAAPAGGALTNPPPGADAPQGAVGVAGPAEPALPSAPPPVAATPTIASTADSASSVDADADAASAEARPGTLRVTVIPWGDVWVDGRYMGRAPAEVTLRPGRHTVAAGTDGPTARRSVQIVAGQARRIELDLGP